jgi:hypothetical protein
MTSYGNEGRGPTSDMSPRTTFGAVASSGGASGNPTVTLSTTGANSLIAAGNDWDTAAERTVPAGQQLLAQYLAVLGDTFWA